MTVSAATPSPEPATDRVDRVGAKIRSAYRDVELAVREGTMLVGHDGTVVDVVRAHERMGVEREDLLGGAPLPEGWRMYDDEGTEVEPDSHPALCALRGNEQHERVLRYESPTGESRTLRFVAYPVADDPVVAVDVLVTDPELRRRTRQHVEAQETRFRTMTDMLPVAVWEAAITGEITYVNPEFTRIAGLELPDVPDLPMLELVHPDDRLTVMDAAASAIDANHYRSQYRLMHADGTARWVISRMSILVDEHGKMNGFAGAIEDVDDLRRSQQRSAELAQLVEAASDAIAIIDDGAVTYLNASAKMLLERTDPGFVVDRSRHVFVEQCTARYAREIEASLVTSSTWSGEFRLTDVDGERTDLSVVVNAEVHDARIRRWVLTARDIREQKNREDLLVHDAIHDSLTGLLNRYGLDRAVATIDPEQEVEVCFVDIDDFKSINDASGHPAGDAVLAEVAVRVRTVVGDDAIVARVGGDEIVVARLVHAALRSEIPDQLVTAIADRAIRLPDERTCRVTASVGSASGRVVEFDALIAAADRALYDAKQAGRNTWRV